MPDNKRTKADIIDNVHEKVSVSKKDIHVVMDAILDEIKASIVDGYGVELRGFGTFSIKVRKGREKARNPRTGESVSVVSHGVAVFKPGRELKQEVWQISNTNDEDASK